MKNLSEQIVEITSFTLTAGISDEVFTDAARSMQKDFLEKQEGFIQRTLTRSGEGLWRDIVFWQDHHSLEQAMRKAGETDVVMPFMEKIDVESVNMDITSPVLLDA